MGSRSQSLQWQGKPLLCTLLEDAEVCAAVCQTQLVLQGDEVGDDPWMEFDWFKLLRKRVFQWKGAKLLSSRQHIPRLPGQIVSCITIPPWPKPRLECDTVTLYADWSTVDPMEYLTPFIEVIRSPEISGPITGVALTAVTRFLDAYIIGECQQCVVSPCTLLLMSPEIHAIHSPLRSIMSCVSCSYWL